MSALLSEAVLNPAPNRAIYARTSVILRPHPLRRPAKGDKEAIPDSHANRTHVSQKAITVPFSISHGKLRVSQCPASRGLPHGPSICAQLFKILNASSLVGTLEEEEPAGSPYLIRKNGRASEALRECKADSKEGSRLPPIREERALGSGPVASFHRRRTVPDIFGKLRQAW